MVLLDNMYTGIVRSHRRCLQMAVVFACLVPLWVNEALAAAQDASPTKGIMPTDVSISEAVKLAKDKNCWTKQCQAVRNVSASLNIERDAEVTTMGVARPLPWNARQIAERRWKTLLRMKMENAQELCGLSAKLVSNYNGTIDDGGGFITETLIELAFRLDRERRSSSCLPVVIAAMKRIPANEQAIRAVRTACVYGLKLGHSCDVIASRKN